jgi:hypothetical protein
VSLSTASISQYHPISGKSIEWWPAKATIKRASHLADEEEPVREPLDRVQHQAVAVPHVALVPQVRLQPRVQRPATTCGCRQSGTGFHGQ